MDGSSYEKKETGLHLKRLKTSEENKLDFIDELPDPILVHILSFLPLRDAVRTVLLRRFGNLWLSLPVLDLDNCMHHEYEDGVDVEICDYGKFMDIIHQVWNHPDNRTLDKLHLNFWCPLTYSKTQLDFDNPYVGGDHERREVEKEKFTAYQLEKLLKCAISRKVKVLDLNFKGCGYYPPLHEFYELPDVFTSNYLTELRLVACDIRFWEKGNLPALRILFLNEVYLSDKAMGRILSGCPILENLSVVDCYGLGNLNSENPNLKKVMLSQQAGSMRVFVSCPHVVSIEISGWIERVTLLNVSSVVDASIWFSNLFRCEEKAYVDVWMLLLKVCHCKTFKPCRWTILTEKKAKWILKYGFDGEKLWEPEEATFPFLESIMIYAYNISEPYVISMMKFLLKNAPKLKKMVISTDKIFDSEELLTFPRASSEAKICFS